MSGAAGTGVTVRSSLWATALFALCLLFLYGQTTLSMIAIWSRSDTFAHGFLILPISLWLIWERRDYLAPLRPAPAPWVALLLAPGALGWLLAWLGDVLVVQQFALVGMLVVGAWAVLGHRLAAALAFPLLFLFFAVPVGEGLIDPMMEFTATSTVWLIRATGIPVYREGLFFTLPTGQWSVVEACSGVRYIIASVTVGTLFAFQTYVTWWRRLLFIIVSAIVPVFANTLRAYIIVMLGHHSDMTIATGADHLVYGWVFFGLVVFILFWIGSFFREDLQPPPPPGAAGAAVAGSRAALGLTLALALAIAASGPLLAERVQPGGGLAQAPVLPAPTGNWRAHAGPLLPWQPPAMVGGLAQAMYTRGSEPLALQVQFTDGRFDYAEVIGSNRLFAWQDGPWKVVDSDHPRVRVGGREIAVQEATVRGPAGQFIAWSWYQVGHEATANDYLAKLREVAATLGMAPAGTWRVLLVTPYERAGETARQRLQEYLEAHGDALVESLASAAETP